MLTSFLRTVILLVFVILILRLMGKRQLGQLQPSELVVTILLSQVAATPMQDNDIPLLNTVVAMSALAGMEILLSVFAMKNAKVRSIVDGKPVVVIRDGVILQKELKRLRYTVDDLLEALRAKDIFDLTDVDDAVVETNGNVSVIMKAGKRPAAAEVFNPAPPETGIPEVMISDGEVRRDALKRMGLTDADLEKLLRTAGVDEKNVFVLTMDKTGKTTLIAKEAAE